MFELKICLNFTIMSTFHYLYIDKMRELFKDNCGATENIFRFYSNWVFLFFYLDYTKKKNFFTEESKVIFSDLIAKIKLTPKTIMMTERKYCHQYLNVLNNFFSNYMYFYFLPLLKSMEKNRIRIANTYMI